MSSESDGAIVDHSLHGLVSVRLVAAPRRVRERVRRRLGPSTGPGGARPDIVIKFEDRVSTRGRVRFVGLNRAAYDDEHFYLLDRVGNRTRIDMDALGNPCEITCEPGIESLAFLLPVLALRLLRKGHVLLHSSAFVHEGKGVLVAGWQKGGKTETLLAFMAAGADFVGNEWTIVARDGRGLFGVGGSVQVWDWHLQHVPQFRRRLKGRDRQRLALFRLYQAVYRAVPSRVPRGAVARALHQLGLEGGVSALRQARASPEQLFGAALASAPARLDRVFLASVGEGGTSVSSRDPDDLARRIVASQTYERRDLLAAYEQFRYAFPERSSRLLEQARNRELKLLTQAFASKPAYELTHPYPVALGDLFRAADPYCH
jgi:hypothetical protein